MTRHRKARCAVVGAAAALVWIAFGIQAICRAQDAGQPAAASTPSPQSSVSAAAASAPAPSTDPGKQIDELIEQANQQMNVAGQFEKAAESARQALNLSEKLNDKNRSMRAMMYLASAYYYQGRMPEALTMFQQVAALARDVGNRQRLALALNAMAAVLGELGRFEESIGYLYQCLDLAREQRQESMQHTVLINIGELYIRAGEPDKAEAPLRESLQIAHELKPDKPGSNPSKRATELSLKFLGEMEAAREHYKTALAYFQQVRESRPESEQAMIGLLDSMAAIYQRMGEPGKAVELLDEARDRAKKSGSVSYSITLADLGESQGSLGQLNEALGSENLALDEVRKSGGNADYEWQIEWHIGHIDRELGCDEEALTHYRNSIRAIESLRASALNTELGKAGFSSRSHAVYAETADLLYGLGHAEEALEIAERGRARGFVEMLTQTRSGMPDELTPEQAKREAELQARISSLQKAAWKEDISAPDEQKRKAELAAAEDDADSFHAAVRRANPRYAAIRYPQPLSVGRVQSQLLNDSSVLLEFMLGEKRSLVWVISTHSMTVGVLPPRREIEKLTAAYRTLIGSKASALTLQSSQAEIGRVGSALYSMLLRPVANAIPPGARLVIIPDGALDYLPFEALVTGTRRPASGRTEPIYLLEKFSVVYGPSATALAEVAALNARPASWDKALLAFGDPVAAPEAAERFSPSRQAGVRSIDSGPRADTGPALVQTAYDKYAERGYSVARLPFTRLEVLGIGSLFPASERRIYLGPQATEEALRKEDLGQYRYIHFATHGFIDEKQPELSGILFSSDPASHQAEVLDAGEIMRLKLDADMVTLSACSTGLGKLVDGEGMLGLTRAFLYAGARNVTVSLWNVNDAETAVLMKSYYMQLNRGLPKSEALRNAKLELLRGKNPETRHPYFWGAFVLAGNGN